MYVFCFQQRYSYCLVAEAYEPYFLRCSPKEIEYDIVSQDYIANNATDVINSLRKVLVGTISINAHLSLHNCGWISRTVVHPNYSFDKIGEPLINQALLYCNDQEFYSAETSTTECQYGVRELMMKIG